MTLPIGLIPEETNDKYNIKDMVANGWVYIEIQKSIYGLPQAGALANRLLTTCLTATGFYPCQCTPDLWCHMWHPISFVLVNSDFGVKYNDIQHATYLLDVLCKHYDISMDWGGTLFCGITSNGITRQDLLICPCPTTPNRHLLNSNIHAQHAHSTPCTNTLPSLMVTKLP